VKNKYETFPWCCGAGSGWIAHFEGIFAELEEKDIPASGRGKGLNGSS